MARRGRSSSGHWHRNAIEEIPLAWLDVPGMSKTQRKDREVVVEEVYAQKYGAIVQHPAGTQQGTIEPTEDEIGGLFPEETPREETLHPAREGSSMFSPEEVVSVVRRLPRGRAYGESRFPHDRIKYAASRDGTAATCHEEQPASHSLILGESTDNLTRAQHAPSRKRSQGLPTGASMGDLWIWWLVRCRGTSSALDALMGQQGQRQRCRAR